VRSTSKHHTISVRGETYDRLSDRTDRIGPLVDDLVAEALDDPELARQVVERIRAEDRLS